IGATMMASCQRRLRALSRASPLGGALTMGGGGVAPAAGGMPAPRGDNTGCIAAGRASCGGRGFMESLSGLQISDFRFWIDIYKSEIGNRQSEISCCFVYEYIGQKSHLQPQQAQGDRHHQPAGQVVENQVGNPG